MVSDCPFSIICIVDDELGAEITMMVNAQLFSKSKPRVVGSNPAAGIGNFLD